MRTNDLLGLIGLVTFCVLAVGCMVFIFYYALKYETKIENKRLQKINLEVEKLKLQIERLKETKE